MDWKKRMAQGAKIEKDTHRLVGEYILPDTLIRQGGYNPEDFPLSEPPTILDVQKSLQRIKELEEEERLRLFEAEQKLKNQGS